MQDHDSARVEAHMRAVGYHEASDTVEKPSLTQVLVGIIAICFLAYPIVGIALQIWRSVHPS